VSGPRFRHRTRVASILADVAKVLGPDANVETLHDRRKSTVLDPDRCSSRATEEVTAVHVNISPGRPAQAVTSFFAGTRFPVNLFTAPGRQICTQIDEWIDIERSMVTLFHTSANGLEESRLGNGGRIMIS